jgi:hypothetical protein
MRPLGAGGQTGAVVARARFVLTAVLISSERRVAIVNGKPYQLGARVDGAEIVAIEPQAVRLREHGSEHVISLGRQRAVVQGGNAP